MKFSSAERSIEELADSSSTFTATIVTPFGTQAEYKATHLRACGSEGEFGVLPGHIPFLTSLTVGLLHLNTPQGDILWATSGGYAEVLGSRVTILAETAEPSEKIDVPRAQAAQQRALQRLSQRTADIDIERARIALARALNRIAAAAHRSS